ncbi:MAG TPA: MFS transporter [Caulobacteraceae bacterium]|nr:MFS transporter [Caulobacteraceae bacterium]
MADRSQAADAPTMRRRHIAAATIGNALEFYDFLTYAFFAIQIGHAFFPSGNAYASLMLSLATFGAGFVTRPIGALVIGAYSDRVGRKPAMLLCFGLMGVSIVAMALIPSYAAIGVAAPILAVLARMAQGFSLGGEIGSNTAFLLEAAPPEKRGLVVSWQGASQQVALTAAGAVGAMLTAWMPPHLLDAYGWRIAFLLGAVTLPFGLWLRSNLPETLHSAEQPGVAPPAQGSRLNQARGSSRVIGLGLVVLASGTIASYIFNYVVTYAQHTLHMPARDGFVASTCGYVASIGTALAGGWLSDRVGRWRVNVWGNLAFVLLILPVFYWITQARTPFALIVGVTGLSAVGAFIWGSFYAALAESLPKTIRGSGFGIVYSLSIAAFGGTTQLVVTWLLHVTGNALAPAFYLMGAASIGQVALMLMAESAPAPLARRALALAAAPSVAG